MTLSVLTAPRADIPMVAAGRLPLLIVDPARYLDTRELAMHGFDVMPCASANQALAAVSRDAPRLLLVDASLPDMPLATFITRLQQRRADMLVIAMVSATQGREAAEAMQAGAIDYLRKPFDTQQLSACLQHALGVSEAVPDLVAVSHASRQVLQLARRAAQTSASILIGGESGTGKERLARFIHDVSPRAEGPFVAINCAAIPESMLEAILFGYNKGAFTGAVTAQAGKFELAQGGTLLLDEISELPLLLQSKLLRVLQEREVERLGSNQKILLDVRIIAATNRDLRECVAQGVFREDLFYRLDVLPLSWPSLRERRDDILPLANYFIAKHACRPGFQLTAEALRLLLQHDWPGNVRELENVIQRALILARGLHLQPADLMLPSSGSRGTQCDALPAFGEGLAASRRQAEFQYVLETLRHFDGHRTRTAEALGLTTRALRYKLAAMREQGMDIDQMIRA
ncbi:sigma-54-dependent transcriptional regulator [Pseudaeromonas sharmana]|uniref:Sigma-54-dependent transcriptional regulator n=1 Tax=Pseudaeromonas sharmana TaxID=328412 RepID=A0ABV8CNL1_9GAMM